MAFFGFLRCGEFTVPSQSGYDPGELGDIAINNKSATSMIQVIIKQSKTDQFRQGVRLCLGKTGKAICPVSAILPYLAIRGAAPGPLFLYADGSFLTRQRFASAVTTTLQQAGIDDKRYTTHSEPAPLITSLVMHIILFMHSTIMSTSLHLIYSGL